MISQIIRIGHSRGKLCATWLIVVLAQSAMVVAQASEFDRGFTNSTMRLDYFHTGSADLELISVDRIRVEGPWAGSRLHLLDSTNLGKYRFEIVDLETHRVLFSRGFASAFGEWETTREALDGVVRTISEAIRFPEPKNPVQVRLYKRGQDQRFREIWSTVIDPKSRFVQRPALADYPVAAVLENGDPTWKVDLLILGDGYTREEMEKYHDDAESASEDIFSFEPFSSRREDFNVWTVESPAPESGISRPRSGIFRRAPLGTSYNAFDSERYILTLDDRAWRDIAAAAPYDFVLILVNSEKYGGGGIFNLYSTAAADSGFRRYLVVHEFAHHFAGLADEYYTSSVAYEDFHVHRVEPWEPNISAFLDRESLKWGDLVETGIPLPTPWGKSEFEEYSHDYQERRQELRRQGVPEAMMESLFREAQEQFSELLGSEVHAQKVGAFEGAGYQATGLFRPSVDCVMFSRNEVGFCSVCDRAIGRIIDLYSQR